jgi:AcrR family transcriptional regulator
LKGKWDVSSKVAEQEAPSDDGMPEWKKTSVERSLKTARARAQERSDRFVAATIDLMRERGSIDFTVQDVVDRSRMSIRTFYNFFASKDDLLVAVHETILASEVVPRLQARCAEESDPVARVRAYIECMYEMTTKSVRASRALTTYSNRLAETRPADLAKAMQPQIDLIADLIRDVAASGRLESELSPERAAHLLHHTVLSAVHARILGTEGEGALSAQDIWLFCAGGIGVDLSHEST